MTSSGARPESVSVEPRTASSLITPPAIAAAPTHRQCFPRAATWPTVAPASAAVNGASSDM